MSQQEPRFEISASVVRQLGEDLITDEVTALIELVKNSYDADATYVSVEVDTENYPNEEKLYYTQNNDYFEVQPGYISIEDDGTGMGRTEIEKGWLTISLSQKREMKNKGLVTPKRQRTPLGDKGLGRLSTQRLGQRMEMFTCKEDLGEPEKYAKEYSTEYQVAFDWRDFTEDLALTAVPVYFNDTEKEFPRSGTSLIITELRNPQMWKNDEDKSRLISGLTQLLFPFGDVRPFSVFLQINGERIELDTLADSIRDVALGRFSFKYTNGFLEIAGRIRLAKLRGNNSVENQEAYDRLLSIDNGAKFFAYLTNPANKNQIPNIKFTGKDGWFIEYQQEVDSKSLALILINNKIADPGEFHGEIDDFSLRSDKSDRLEDVFNQAAEYRNFVKNQAGVRVFRNGFGIRPYGFDKDDWLGLSGGQTSGRSWYGLRPDNTIGYVALTAKGNANLKETTSREGFVETPYSQNFKKIMDYIIHSISVSVYENLRRSYNNYRKETADSNLQNGLPDAPFKELHIITQETVEIETQVEILEPKIDSLSNAVREIVRRIEDEPLFSTDDEREFAPLFAELNTRLDEVGQTLHQIKSLLSKAKRLGAIADSLEPRIEILETQLTEFSELAGLGLTAEALSHEISTIAQRLAERTTLISRYLKKQKIADAEIISYTEYIHSAISSLKKQLSHLAPSLRYVREKKEPIRIDAFLIDLIGFYDARLRRSGITMKLDEGSSQSFTINMNRGKLTQVIDNLVLNSEFWLKQALSRNEIEDPTITFTVKSPYVIVKDNGFGIEQSIELSLFQPFVTTKPKNEGRGLGLFIISELLDSSGSTISLRPERNSFGRRYIFQIDLTGVIDGS